MALFVFVIGMSLILSVIFDRDDSGRVLLGKLVIGIAMAIWAIVSCNIPGQVIKEQYLTLEVQRANNIDYVIYPCKDSLCLVNLNTTFGRSFEEGDCETVMLYSYSNRAGWYGGIYWPETEHLEVRLSLLK